MNTLGQKKRAAQVWAIEISSKIEEQIRAGHALPFQLPVRGYTKGQAIRFAQEVNYAKKHQDSLEKQLYIQRVAASKSSYLNEPIPLAWALSFKMVEGEAIFTVNYPSIKSRQQTEITKKFTLDALAALDALPMPEAGLKPSAPTEDDILNSYLYGDKS